MEARALGGPAYTRCVQRARGFARPRHESLRPSGFSGRDPLEMSGGGRAGDASRANPAMGLTGQRTPPQRASADRTVFAPLKQRDACMRRRSMRARRLHRESGVSAASPTRARLHGGFRTRRALVSVVVADSPGEELPHAFGILIDEKLNCRTLDHVSSRRQEGARDYGNVDR